VTFNELTGTMLCLGLLVRIAQRTRSTRRRLSVAAKPRSLALAGS